MYGFQDLQDFFLDQNTNVIIAADGETRAHTTINHQLVLKTPAGGVSVGFDALARAAHATYIARGKSTDDQLAVDRDGKVTIDHESGSYTLKRLFFSERDVQDYYYGFSNQTLWPLCHVAFEKPIFNKEWYEGYARVNRQFADAIKTEIKGKTMVWINDYQLSLVPTYLGKRKDVSVGFFWHIPWPTWEIFRTLPHKKDILWSLLSCDFLAFHRGYQMRNFMETVARELEARIDEERGMIYFDDNVLKVASLPMGIDTDVISGLVKPEPDDTFLSDAIRKVFGIKKTPPAYRKEDPLAKLFNEYKIILGIDRLDYTKGLEQRLDALDRFFDLNPQYREKVLYLGIMAPSRDTIPSYKELRTRVEDKANMINKKYRTKTWRPLYLIYESFAREELINFYQKAAVCLVTPLDDGMNLVSKEFVIASGKAEKPGMLILSQFAGSAIDLNSSLIVNPYDTDAVANAIRKALEMPVTERKERTAHMVTLLEERNIYEWARQFAWGTMVAARENKQQQEY